MLPSGLKINKEKRNIWVQISWKAQNEILNNPDSSWTLSFFWWGMCHHLQRDPGREQQRNRVSRDVGQLADARPAVPLQKLRVPQMLPVLDSKAIRRGPGGTPPSLSHSCPPPRDVGTAQLSLLHLQDWLGRCFSAHLAVSKGFKIFDLRPFSKHFKLPNR